MKGKYAGVMELADMQDLGSCAERRVGSSPTVRIDGKRAFFLGKGPFFLHYRQDYFTEISMPVLVPQKFHTF